MNYASIIGTGSYLPENILTNDDLAKIVETSDEWIITRTGIKQRRISTGENTSDLAYKAASRALENANMEASDLDLIICATITPDSFMPSVACVVQNHLGAKKAAAFDLTAACSGLVYAMAVASSFIESGMYTNILVIGAETISKALNWEDRSTCVLFGDGAGALVLSATGQKKGIMSAHLTSDGSKQDCLCLPAVPLSNPFVKREDDNFRPTITMNGQEVFKFAVRTIDDLIKKVLLKADLKEKDIKYVVAHQANLRILEHAAKTSKIPLEKFFVNIDLYANTSAATIAIALDEMVQKNMLQPGDKIILIGFGAGLTSGAILVEWS